MRKELIKLNINNHEGGSQRWLQSDPFMYLGGCAAISACDMSIYFAKLYGLTKLYPFDLEKISKADYKKFSKQMKPYLKPRIEGVSDLQIFVDGYQKYLTDQGESRLSMKALSSYEPFDKLKAAVVEQINLELPLPFLVLQHKNKKLDDYSWHWFWITGYDDKADNNPDQDQAEDGGSDLMVKVISYGKPAWLSLYDLYNSGFDRKGGLILFELTK